MKNVRKVVINRNKRYKKYLEKMKMLLQLRDLRNSLKMYLKENILWALIRKSTKQRCVRTGSWQELANLVLHVHLPMEKMNFIKRNIFQVTIKPNYVSNSMKLLIALMEIDANFYILDSLSTKNNLDLEPNLMKMLGCLYRELVNCRIIANTSISIFLKLVDLKCSNLMNKRNDIFII